jgi:hypothetical protein
MSPHPTEKDAEDSQPASMESGVPSSSKEDIIKINGNNSVASSTNTEVGAKRRKPLKTNKVTQQLQTSELTDEEDTLEEKEYISEQSPLPPPPPLHLAPTLTDQQKKHVLQSPSLPRGMPIPPISSNSVVESTSDKKYKCPLCLETLQSQNAFTQHIRGHNEVKPQNDPNDPTGQSKVYYCCLCGKMLSSFSSLDRHMLVHSGERKKT